MEKGSYLHRNKSQGGLRPTVADSGTRSRPHASHGSVHAHGQHGAMLSLTGVQKRVAHTPFVKKIFEDTSTVWRGIKIQNSKMGKLRYHERTKVSSKPVKS